MKRSIFHISVCLLLFTSCSSSRHPGGDYSETDFYKFPHKLVKKEIYRRDPASGMDWVWERKVFYEEWPNGKYVFLGKEGTLTYEKGHAILFSTDSVYHGLPDGVIYRTLDKKGNELILVSENERFVPYTKGKHNKIEEMVYNGDKPGIYKWKNGERYFVRPLSKNDSIEAKRYETFAPPQPVWNDSTKN